MQRVHDQQLLVLLLVVDTQLDDLGLRLIEPVLDPGADGLLDVRPVAATSPVEGRVTSPRCGRGCRGPTAS